VDEIKFWSVVMHVSYGLGLVTLGGAIGFQFFFEYKYNVYFILLVFGLFLLSYNFILLGSMVEGNVSFCKMMQYMKRLEETINDSNNKNRKKGA